jgi:hypothetical protein
MEGESGRERRDIEVSERDREVGEKESKTVKRILSMLLFMFHAQ